MEIVLKIIQVLPAQEGIGKNGNPWKVQPYVGETQEQYAKKVCFEVFGEDRITNNPCSEDEVVTVSYDIESREFNGRWYTSIRAWKIQHGDTTSQQPAAQPAPAAQGGTIYPDAQQQVTGGGSPADAAYVPPTGTTQAPPASDAGVGADSGSDLPF